MALKLKFKGGYTWRKVKADYFEMILLTNSFMNCQVGTVAGIEEILDTFLPSKEVRRVLKELGIIRINMVTFDVGVNYSKNVEKHFDGAIAGSMPYTSTNGNRRVIYIVNLTKL